jgi:hypothetical protein
MNERHYLAVDLGAESGRVMLGKLKADRLELQGIHRFPNGIIPRGLGLFWNLPEMENQISLGFKEVERLNIHHQCQHRFMGTRLRAAQRERQFHHGIPLL